MESETFRIVPGWPNYEVSNLGRVRSLRRRVGDYRGNTISTEPRFLTPVRHRNGYWVVTLFGGTPKRKIIGIHALVLTVFHRPPHPGEEARHFPDGDKSNNRLENLAWGRKFENELDKPRQRSSQKRLTREEILEIRSLKGTGQTQASLGERYGVNPSAISRIWSGEYWKHVVT